MLGTNNELISNVLQWNPTYGHTSVDWAAKNYIRQCWYWVPSRDLQNDRQTDRPRERERERERKEICAVGTYCQPHIQHSLGISKWISLWKKYNHMKFLREFRGKTLDCCFGNNPSTNTVILIIKQLPSMEILAQSAGAAEYAKCISVEG